jgi:hypothetical protein
LYPNGSIASPSATSTTLERVKFVKYPHRRAAQWTYGMPKQFGSSDIGKPFVKSAATMARLPNEFEEIAAPWMQGIELFARFSWTIGSVERVVYNEMWNTLLTSSCHEDEESENFGSTRLSAMRTAI